MTEGISKERLIELTNNLYGLSVYDLRRKLLDNCVELDPWMPIDGAPKDGREVCLKEDDNVDVGFWDEDLNMWYVYDMTPTHYREIKL